VRFAVHRSAEDCGFEVRGGGNATQHIVDIMPPSFPAHRSIGCEAYTLSGTWLSLLLHKHDADNPPSEVKLEDRLYSPRDDVADYLKVLAGRPRSMAASDDPQYASFRAWPAPDPRVPIVAPPTGGVHGA
jgi:hypothetical protein